MSNRSPSGRFSAWLLLAPLFGFMLLFFVGPLVTMVSQAVSDPIASRILPLTARASVKWTSGSPPSAAMKSALAADLKNAGDAQEVGDLVRRLNSAKPGFRTLMSKTLAAVRKGAPDDLASVDPRWDDTQFWQVIVDALSPMTDRYLLAAVDLARDNSGTIVEVPSDQSANRAILLRTFWIAGIVTFFAALIGLPYAMVIASTSGGVRTLLLGAVLLPLWTSLLVRTAAWFILLQDQGLINDTLRTLGVIDQSLPLLFNRTGVVIAITHVLLPFMVLPIYSVLIAIPRNLMPAAASLGAPPIRAFLWVLLPLSLRGIASGSLLVFMSAIGYYITPALIGGPGDQMISSVIAFYAMGSANWGMAAALGIALFGITILLYAVYGRLSAEDGKSR